MLTYAVHPHFSGPDRAVSLEYVPMYRVVQKKRTFSIHHTSGAARGEASPLWGDVQKLCSMCVLLLSWNFLISHDKYIARPSSKEPR